MTDSIVGIIPCAGTASRFQSLPKFLLPCPDGHLIGTLSRRMYTAGASKVWIGASKANEPFVSPYSSGETIQVIPEGQGMPKAVLAGRKAAGESIVLLGMPDTYWNYHEAFEKLLHRINVFGAEVAVGLWRIRNDQRGKLGQVDTWGDRCTRVVDKDETCLLPWAWGAIAFKPSFWQYISPDHKHMGQAIQGAIDANAQVWPVMMEGEYWDCGDWASYSLMCAHFAGEAVR